jgi:ankyrin repeat protein
MRLLQIKDGGELSLVECLGTVPPYAILSHTWGSKSDEVSYQDMTNGTAIDKPAYRKFTFCIEQATKDNLTYFWIDTCCIDKSSSAELSEAITSMFRWYQNSVQCYVYLQDVSTKKRKADFESQSFPWEPAFRESQWFSRGWTLQELLAPSVVTFYSADGQFLGDKLSLEPMIHEITRIPILALRGAPLQQCDIHERMSWAAKRETTRAEDGAYALLGIFGVSLPAVYGEGREIAFKRLNREISEVAATENWPLSKREKEILLKSLQFDQIEARCMAIQEPHARTCEWIFKDPTYLAWHDATKLEYHHGFLWIKGRPGTGKSTLIKSVMNNVRDTVKGSTVVSFFFNARGEELERSTLGMYRSLLLQLLVQYPSLEKVLDTLGLAERNFTTHSWSIESLKSLMRQAIKGLGRSSLICFVDALDECEEEEIRDMIQFFESLGDLAVSRHICFQICCSSRYYPHISVRKGLSLQLESQEGHILDITNYVATELRIDERSKSALAIREEIQEKASGIFMWVVLVVGILNKEYDAGRVHTLQKRIQELPSDLYKLFRNILTRDSHYKDELLLCIQWVLFAKYPLSPEQLYFAVLAATEPQAAFDWNPEEISKDTIARFIIHSSKGLVGITGSPNQRVHFIHESLRDFLLKDDELSNIWPELESNLHGWSHERLKHCCLMYLTMNFPTVATILEYFNDLENRDDTLCDNIAEIFPFLQYAIECVLIHADLAEGSGIAQKTLLETFPLQQWIQMNNVYQAESRRHAPNATFLYILAELDMSNLIKIHISASRCLEMEAGRYGCPLFAAIANGSIDATQACLDAIESIWASPDHPSESNRTVQSQRLRQYPSKHDFAYDNARGLFFAATALGGEQLVVHLASLGSFQADTRDAEGRTPLWWASRYGWEEVIRLLLVNTTAPSLDIQDKDGNSALYVAVERNNQSIIQLLLNAGANVNAQGGVYGNLLHIAARTGVVEVVKLLLDAGADINATADLYGNALHAAAYGGHKTVVELLVDRGADINAHGPWGSVLMAASKRRHHEDVAKLLRERGAK